MMYSPQIKGRNSLPVTNSLKGSQEMFDVD